MASTAWRINGIDTDGHDLVLSRIQPWGANGAMNPVSVTSTLESLTGDVGNLIVDDITECTFAAADVRKPGFSIDVTFAAPVDLWGFRFAGPNEQTWPVQHAVSDRLLSTTVNRVQWLPNTISPAPTRALTLGAVLGTWLPQTGVGNTTWQTCAMSADGQVLLAAAATGNPMLSKDRGVTWVAQPALVSQNWFSCSVSADGQVLLACPYGGTPWLSKDGGATWVAQTQAGGRNWHASAVSADGRVLLICAFAGTPWLSKDAGATWVAQTALGVQPWKACAASADGQILVVSPGAGNPWLSKDGGTTWVEQTTAGYGAWSGVAMSADGLVMLGCISGGRVLLSKDRGGTWVAQTTLGAQTWGACAVSADGQVLLACPYGDNMWLSDDGGNTWVAQKQAGGRNWYASAVSADGRVLLTCVRIGAVWRQETADPIYQPVPMRMSAVTADAAIKGVDLLPQGWGSAPKVDAFAFADMEFGGNGYIYGTVELYSQAGNIRLPRRVRLHRSRDGLLVRETWSDAQGNYRFEHISERYTYDVIAWDHEGLQQSVVANDLAPELMS